MKDIDMTEFSNYADFVLENRGYYFYDKKEKQEVEKWLIHLTFEDEGFEGIYNDLQGRYCRIKKNEI